MIALLGIGTAYSLYIRRPGFTLALRDRCRALHAFLVQQVVLRRALRQRVRAAHVAAGRFGRDVVERRVVQDVVMGWATRARARLLGFVREIQSGYVRAYALLFLMGMGSLGLYFLIVSG